MIAGYLVSVLGALVAAATMSSQGLGLVASVLGYVVTGGIILIAYGALRTGGEDSA